jgi:DNA-binding transcriptional LysR family regulator
LANENRAFRAGRAASGRKAPQATFGTWTSGATVINTLQNISAFLVVARLGSFSAAARELSVAASVVTKRITQLEERMRTKLIVRSTRGLALTPAGERLIPRFQRLVGELEELFVERTADEGGIEGHLRIKGPTTITSLYLGALFTEFQAANPRVTLEVVLMDRSVNPLEEGFELVVAARAASYPNVVDVPLCAYPQVLCCSPGYLREHTEPRHPGELIDHDCLTTVLFGTTWPFDTPRGALSVEVRSRLHANDGRVVLEAARRGLGFAPLPAYLVTRDLSAGTLVQVLQGYPMAVSWLKALVPRMKIDKPAVRELIAFLKSRMHPVAPWDESATAGAR